MIENGVSVLPARTDVRIRQADRGRDNSAGTIGMIRWLEDVRLRIRLRRFERLVTEGRFERFQILLVSQGVDRLAPVGPAVTTVEVHTGIRRIGRSSFSYEHSIFADGKQVGSGEATVVLGGAAGPLTLPDELIADLTDLRAPESDQAAMPRPGAERPRRDRYAHFFPLRSRIGDVDMNHHVNYIALATWYDEAIAAFTIQTIGTDSGVPDLPAWSYRVQYSGEVTYPGDYEIGLSVSSFDADAVHYELAVFRGDECLGIADATGSRGELPADPLSQRAAPQHAATTNEPAE
nr:hypothetical protein [Kibdelosporangium sp. MJ126-NF4]CEL16517.1 putative 4-hydroxybenzoyl-CoA thioesterase [Kibdelosporangium sp. MJ126-NF4]CTQ90470.1 putative 4-hydroxybenzoyl-CoA thioesterase [Kibdelosporangium sp. MJ126-NF4]